MCSSDLFGVYLVFEWYFRRNWQTLDIEVRKTTTTLWILSSKRKILTDKTGRYVDTTPVHFGEVPQRRPTTALFYFGGMGALADGFRRRVIKYSGTRSCGNLTMGLLPC